MDVESGHRFAAWVATWVALVAAWVATQARNPDGCGEWTPWKPSGGWESYTESSPKGGSGYIHPCEWPEEGKCVHLGIADGTSGTQDDRLSGYGRAGTQK